MKLYRFLIISMTIVIASCQSKDDLQQSQITDGNAVLSVESQSIVSTGGSFSMAITANSAWSVSGCPEWLSISKTSGKSGTTSINISARCNETRENRAADIEFRAQDGSFSKVVKVTQAFPYLRIDKDKLDFNWNDCRTIREEVVTDNNPQQIKITSNVAWRIEEVKTKADGVDVSFITLSADSGKDDYDLSIIPIRDNYDKVPYDVTLRLYPVVRDSDGHETEVPSAAADSYELKVHQKNLKFLINDSVEDADYELNELNDNPTTFTIDSEIEWNVSGCPEWVKLDKTKGKDLVILKLEADGANPTLEERRGVVRLLTKAGAFRDISVFQKPYLFSTDIDQITMGNDDLSEYKVNLSTTGTWEIKNVPSWLTVTPTVCTKTTSETGKSIHEITIKAKGQNLQLEDNLQSIQLCSSMNDIVKEFPVKQDKYVFTVQPDNNLIDLATMDTNEYPVRIESSGKWELTNVPDWLVVDKQSSDTKGITDIKVKASTGNPDVTADRQATLKVVSVTHRDAGQTVTREFMVKQRKYIFDVTPTGTITILPYRKNWSSNQVTVTIDCSAQWKLEEWPSWISPNVTSGDGSKVATIAFTPVTNMVKNGRSGIIRIKSLYNNEERTIPITQEAFVFDNGSKTFNVKVLNTESFPVSFNLSQEVGWSLNSGYPTWLKPSATNGEGTSTVIFTPDQNLDLSERIGMVKIVCNLTGEEKPVTFSQEAYVFDASSESYSYTELDQNSDSFTVTSSGPWEVQGAPDWLEISPRSGDMTATVTIHPKNNIALSSRTKQFNVVSTLNNLKKPITVSQAAFKFDSTPLSFEFEALEETVKNIDIICSGAWTAQNKPNWVEFPVSGNGSQTAEPETIVLESMKNYTENDRSATIVIVSNDNASFKKEIRVMQKKFVFEISPASLVFDSPVGTENPSQNVTVNCMSNWKVEKDDWINLTSSSGAGNGSFSVSVQNNDSGATRFGKLIITTQPDPGNATIMLKKEISVTQK